MHASDRLPDEALDGLLDGTPSEDAVGSPLAAYLSALREDAETTAPAPSSRLQTLLAEGMDPAELEDADVAPSPTRGALGWRRRGHLPRGALVTKLAALGMLTKVAAAGAAVTVAASGAGVAGVLPQPAQHAFDDVVGRQVDDDPTAADERDEVDGAAEVQPQP